MECTRAVLRTVRTFRTAVLVVATALLAGGVLVNSPSGPAPAPLALADRVDAANRGW